MDFCEEYSKSPAVRPITANTADIMPLVVKKAQAWDTPPPTQSVTTGFRV